MAELYAEQGLLALETVRGTAIAAPTHLLTAGLMITPDVIHYEPVDATGTLVETTRNAITRKLATFEIPEGPADTRLVPVLANMVYKALAVPSTPGGATDARLWEHPRVVNADSIKSATLWAMDPATQVISSDYAMLQELTFTNDTTAEDGVLMVSGSGICGFPADAADPVVPAASSGELLPAAHMQLWLDTTSAIGTTEVTGRIIRATHVLRSGVTAKYPATGAGGALDYSRTGRQKVRGMTTTIVLELDDMTQYDLFTEGTSVKCRVRHNGPIIEAALRHFVEFDCYGPLRSFAWGEAFDSNRTIELTIESRYDATLGSDARVAVQNASATL